MRHFFSRLFGFAAFAAIVTALLAFVPAAAAEDIKIGGYTFDAGEIVEEPVIFVSDDSEEDRIVFEKNAGIDTNVSYEPVQWEKTFAQWAKWHRETGANPYLVNEYDLGPLAAFTMGSGYDWIRLEEGARIVNSGDVGDGMKTMGPVSVDVGPDAVVHGNWSAVSLGNFEDPENEDFFTVSITNQGTIGTFMNDFESAPFEMTSQQGIVFYEGVEGTIVNELTGAIRGEHAGIYTNYKPGEDSEESYTDPYQLREDFSYAEGRSLTIENRGEITGGFYGIYEGGGLEDVEIVNYEEGRIEGGSVGLYLGRGGSVENLGDIEGEEVGIFVAAGTADITHSGTLTVAGEEDAEAIRFGRDAEGGVVTLYRTVDGGILHLGETGEAILNFEAPLEAASQNDSLSVGNIAIGDGVIAQHGGNWFYKEILARSIFLEDGQMHLGQNVVAGSSIDVESGAVLTITGGRVSTEDFINRGVLNFQDGEILINGGLFDYANQAGARDLRISGANAAQNPRLRLEEGASAAGIDILRIGGDYAGSLTLAENARVSVSDRLSVYEKGVLAGVGTVEGNAAVHKGGTLQPGHADMPTGTLYVEGDLDIGAGAVLDIGVGKDEQNIAKIDVSGNVLIDSSAVVQMTDYSRFTLRDGSEYTFLTAGGSREGEFAGIESFSPVYEFEPFYGASNASFRVKRLAAYSDYVGEGQKYYTKNRAGYTSVVESAWEDGRLEDLQYSMDWLLGRVLEDRAPVSDLIETIDTLSPEPYQAGYRMAADQAIQMNRRFFRGARTSRLQIGTASETRARIMTGQIGESRANSGMRVFYGGYRRVVDIEGAPARTGHTYKLRGGYLGVERNRKEGLLAGFGLGYADGSAGFDNGGTLEMKTLRVGPHATIDRGSLELDVALNLGWHPIRQKRNMSHIYREAVSRYNIWDASVYTGVRYNLTFRDQWRLAPSASLQYTHQYRDSFIERYAGDASLKLDAEFNEILRSMVGMQFSREFRMSRFVLVPELFGGWEYDLLDPDMTIDAQFLEAPGSTFRMDADAPGKDSLVYGAGLTVLFGEYNVAFATYELEETDAGEGYTFSAGVKWNF